MFCKYCGKDLKDDKSARFCPGCGKENPAGAVVQQHKHAGTGQRNTSAGHLGRLIGLLFTCAAVSVLGYLLQIRAYTLAFCDMEFSIWQMLLPILVGSALIFILHYKGKIVDERVNAMAYVVSGTGFFLIYGIGILTVKVCWWFGFGTTATGAMYVNMVYTGIFGLKYVWPWLMLACYLISKPSPRSKRNKLLVVGAVILGNVILHGLRGPLFKGIGNAAGCQWLPYGNPAVLLAGIQLVLLYIAQVARYEKKRSIIAVVLIIFIISSLLMILLAAWLRLGGQGIYVAELLAYLVGAGILFLMTKSK